MKKLVVGTAALSVAMLALGGTASAAPKAPKAPKANETITITLDVAVPPTKVVPATHHRHAGFLTGLRHGWTALTDTVVVGLTALGAVLPFAVLLAAVGLPLWWWARRRAGTGPAAPAEAASGD